MLRLPKPLVFVLLGPLAGFGWDSAPPCQRFWEVDAVFVASVVDDGVDEPGAVWGPRRARVAVEEAFIGAGAGEEIEIDPGITTECYLRMRKGQRYFIYARREADGALRTSACLGSIRLDLAGEELRFARGLVRGEVTTTLSGLVRANGTAPLPGVEIIASGNGNQYRTVTAPDGRFAIAPVDPGKYEIRAALDGYVSEVPAYRSEVHERGCAEVNVGLWTDGRIGGVVSDATGAPVSGVQIELAALDEAGELTRPRQSAAGEQGRFEFTRLAAGRYILGVNLNRQPSVDVPYAETRAADAIKLQKGARLSGVELRLPPRLGRRTVHIQAIWPNGEPAAEAQISGFDHRFETDAQGKASAPVLLDARPEIQAVARTAPGQAARSKSVLVPPGAEPVVILVLEPAPARQMRK